MKRALRLAAIVGLLVAGLALFASSEIGQLLLGRWSFVASDTTDRGTFFRLKVKLTYKGEPQDFDIVVGCNVRLIQYKDGSDTYEAGLIPTVYGRRMSDGKGLVVRPPDACRGQTTANGRVPADFMPMAIVYDDADTLAFGTAYISDDAYASPLSLLTFGGATVEAATKDEFEEFRKNGQPNLVTREQYLPGAQLAKMGLQKAKPPFGDWCRVFSRFRIPEAAREHVRTYWPADMPEYWVPPTYELTVAAERPIFETQYRELDTGGALVSFLALQAPETIDDRGVARRAGGGLIDQKARLAVGPSYFPADSDLSADRWPIDVVVNQASGPTAGETVLVRVVFRDGTARGFAYCYSRASTSTGGGVAYVDDIQVSGVDPTRTIQLFFEEDKYYFSIFDFNIESTRGDV